MSTTSQTLDKAATPAATTTAEQVQIEIRTLRKKIQNSARVTAIVAGIMLVAMCAYFFWGYRMWKEVTRPANLADFAQLQVEQNLPGVRKSLEEQVAKAAPIWAKSLSKQALDYIPEGRKKFEKFAIDQLDEAVDHAQLLTQKEFTKFVDKNRSLLEQHIKNLAENPKQTEKSLQDVIVALEQDQEFNMKNEIRDMLTTFRNTNEYWKYLQMGKDMTDEARLERRVWMLARGLHMEFTNAEKRAEAPPRPTKTALKGN